MSDNTEYLAAHMTLWMTSFAFILLASGHVLAQTIAPASAPVGPPAGFDDCQMCHNTTKDASPSIGPNLFGVGGRRAGSTDFSYSSAMQASGITWTSDTLQAFITNPSKTVPGTQMDYQGASDPATAKAIAEYLLTLKN